MSNFDKGFFVEKRVDGRSGKIKKIAESSPSRAGYGSDHDFPTFGVDSQSQVQFVGKIRKQRILKNMEKKNKFDESFTDHVEVPVVVKKTKEETPKEKTEPKEEEKEEEIVENPDEIKWDGRYNEE